MPNNVTSLATARIGLPKPEIQAAGSIPPVRHATQSKKIDRTIPSAESNL